MGDETGSAWPPQRRLEVQGAGHDAVPAIGPDDQSRPQGLATSVDRCHDTLDVTLSGNQIADMSAFSHLDACLASAVQQQGIEPVAREAERALPWSSGFEVDQKALTIRRVDGHECHSVRPQGPQLSAESKVTENPGSGRIDVLGAWFVAGKPCLVE
jgi:hypothetical protein